MIEPSFTVRLFHLVTRAPPFLLDVFEVERAKVLPRLGKSRVFRDFCKALARATGSELVTVHRVEFCNDFRSPTFAVQKS